MNLTQLSPLVIFPDDFFSQIKNESDFNIWLSLQGNFKHNDYREDSIDSVLQNYTPVVDEKYFYGIQLNFFLIRNSQNTHCKLEELIQYWVSSVEKKVSSLMALNFLPLLLLSNSSLIKHGKYYYNIDYYLGYVKSWNYCTVDLATWRHYRFLSLPDDFYFLKPFFKDNGDFTFSQTHMRKLFDEYVGLIYNRSFKPRTLNRTLVEMDKAAITSVLHNKASSDEKSYLHKTFGLHKWGSISENLSKCLSDKMYPQDFDINLDRNYASFYALIRYYNELTSPPEKQTVQKFAMWFKNLPTDQDKKSEFYEILKDIFDLIHSNCPKAVWSDFKSIFSSNGSTVKIEWEGEASFLNYIFRSLKDILAFNGSKWDVVAFYFDGKDKNGISLTSKRLIGNSHYDDKKNEKLRDRLNDLILILSRKP